MEARAYRDGVANSALKRVGEFDEHLAIEPFETVGVRQLAIVAVAEEHHRLPIQLVGKERGSTETPLAALHDRRIERRRARRRDVLPDSADEEPRRERVGPLHTRDSLREESRPWGRWN